MRRAQITVAREDAETVTLTEKEDDIKLGDIDTLRLVDIETGGPTWTLKCYSHEWLANTVEPTAGGTLRTGSDADLVNGWITDVSQWTAGTVTQQATGLSFVFNHAAPHEGLRRVEKNVPGELKFRDTGTVDYIDRLGSDKTGSVTLSSANQNIEDEIRITKRGRELDGTHIRVLGAHEGEAQFFANLVPSDDSANYDNRVNYSTSRWSDGNTRDWDRYVNKDVTDQATIEEEAAELGTEITERLVEAKATTTLDLDIGDTVQVTKTDADLDRAMRAHRIKEVAEGGTVKRELLLSTRTIVRSDDAEDLRDIQRFNSGFQGSSVVVQGGGSRQPVDAQNNAEIPFFYPDLEFENKAELFVRGLTYRAYSSGAASGGGDTTTSTASDRGGTNLLASKDYASDQTLAPGDKTTLTTTISEDAATGHSLVKIGFDTNDVKNDQQVYVKCVTGITRIFEAGIRNATTGQWYYAGMTGQELEKNDTVEFEVKNPSSNSNTFTISASESSGISVQDPDHTHKVTFPDHTHEPEPGISEFGNETPTAVDVLVDSNKVATDIGTGTFQTTVDISNELTKNAWNLIELTSDDLGHIQTTVSIKGYDKIGSG